MAATNSKSRMSSAYTLFSRHKSAILRRIQSVLSWIERFLCQKCQTIGMKFLHECETRRRRLEAVRFPKGLKDSHLIDAAARAGGGGAQRVSHVEHEGRLPGGVAGEFGQRVGGFRRLVAITLVVDQLDRSVRRTAGDVQ